MFYRNLWVSFMEKPSFGYWLKQRRNALYLTQSDLAKRVGCAVVTITKIEADQRRPSKEFATRLAEVLEIAPEKWSVFVEFARGEAQAGATHIFHSKNNLPAQMTPLIGRERETKAICQMLLREDTRLLNLTGAPGIGKTRLALQAVAEVSGSFGDGVYFVSLAPIEDSQSVLPAIAQILGVVQISQRSWMDRLTDYLQGKIFLLVLDNFEHLVEAAPHIVQLLQRCPLLKVLVTSRIPLAVRGEKQYLVPPLPLPEIDSLRTFEMLEKNPAIRLFKDRAQAVCTHLDIDIKNLQTIGRICHRLDGVPLAIELVSARTKFLSPSTLLEHLTSQMILHADGLRDIEPRQKTLFSAVDWSYQLLKPEEQRFFVKLAVFKGGWTIESSAAVCDLASDTTWGLITALVDKNLIVHYQEQGQLRFRMLEPIREFVLEKFLNLTDSESQAIHDRHARFYIQLAEEAEGKLRGPQQLQGLRELELDQLNLRTAFDWLLEHDLEAGAKLAGAMWWFWNIRGYLDESTYWLEKIIIKGDLVSTARRAKVLACFGNLAWQREELELARENLQKGVALYRNFLPECQWDLALALCALAMVGVYQGDYDLAHTASEESMNLFYALEDSWGIALTLNPVGKIDLMRHDYQAARAHFEESLALFRKVGDRWGMAIPLLNVGSVSYFEGKYEEAYSELEESVDLFRKVGEKWTLSLTLSVLAEVAFCQGDHQRSSIYLAECVELLRKLGSKVEVAVSLYEFAKLSQSQGGIEGAAMLYRGSLLMFREEHNVEGILHCLEGFADLASVTGEIRHRTQLLEAAETLRAMRDIRSEKLDEVVALVLGR